MSRPQRLSRRQFLGTAGAAGALVVLGGPATLARSSGRSRNTSVVVRRNEALVQAIRQSRMGPPMVARALAMAHTCMYDAWAAHDARAVGTRLGGDLRRHHREQRRAHKETAISVAAYRAAVDLFPAAASGVFDPLMLGSGSSAVALPPEIRQRLASALDEKARAEAYLASSGMTYTIIRPGGLKSEPPTGRGALTRDPRISGTIHRAEVAELIYACLVSDRTDNMTLSAVDRDMVRDHLAFEPFALESIG